MNKLAIFGFLILATTFEAVGDALVRMGLIQQTPALRIALFAGGAALLFGYGVWLNLAPTDFGRVVGLYIALLFVMFQIVNFFVFRATPTVPVLIGGVLIIAGGLVATFWERAPPTN